MQEEHSKDSYKKLLNNLPLQLARNSLLKIPNEIVFPSELNEYFKDQLEHHMRENLSLKHKLSECNIKLEEAKRKTDELSLKLKDYEVLCGKNEFVSSSAVAASKIVELSRKLREKSSELEVQKTKCSKLERALFELKEEQQINKPELPEEKPKNELEDQIKQLQEKLNYAKNKLLETKNVNTQLKNDLKLANKWLQQETGESFDNLVNIHNSNSSWRGRGQIICDLQKKNSDLRERLKNIQDKGIDLTSSNNINKLEKKLDTIIQENSDLKVAMDQLKKKHDGARSRIKYLEAESAFMKNKISKLNEQIDDKQNENSNLIEQLNIQKELRNNNLKLKDGLIVKLQQDCEDFKIELNKKKSAIENLTKMIEEQSQEITVVKNKVRSARPQSSYGNKPKELTQNDNKMMNRLEAERIRLLELTELQSKRLENERNLCQKTESDLKYERQRAAKLEANLARMQLECSTKSSTYSTTSTLNNRESELDILRNKLELAKETIKTLETRLDIEKHERKVDLQQFSNILKTHKDINVNETF